jgi:UDP-glucose 4-epimerase
MKALVTGGAGFIGSHVTDKLIAEGVKTVVVDNLSSPGHRRNVHPGAKLYKMDVLDPALSEVFERERPDAVFHLAAQVDVQKSMADPVFDAQVNLVGTLRILQHCRTYRVKKLVYSSSAAVYGPPRELGIREDHKTVPISFYGLSKLTPESYIRLFADLHGLEYTILRYANVYGPRQDAKGEAGVVALFLDRLLRGERPVIYGSGEQTRDFVYVADVAEANWLALNRAGGETVNIGRNAPVSVNELFECLSRLTGRQQPPVHGQPRTGDIEHSRLDNAKAAELLGWTPRFTLEDGLAATVEYARTQTVLSKHA